MNNDLIDINRHSATRVYRNDADTMVRTTTFFDDDALAQNQRVRDSGMLHNGVSRLHDEHGSDYRAVISCPSTEQWDLFKRLNPSTYSDLMSKHEVDRMKAIKEISLLEPSWVVQMRL